MEWRKVVTATSRRMTCGEALMHLLGDYGVDAVFGIPGEHTLELYRGIESSRVRHVLTRHEQGAGFMADGYGRVTGKPGVCTLITGPGVTNCTTPLAQAYADSVPMLLISSANRSESLGKGWGCLHEITDQSAVTAPLTAFSAMVRTPDEIPELVERQHAKLLRTARRRRYLLECRQGGGLERGPVNRLRDLRSLLPPDTIMFGDIAQLVYTGSAVMPTDRPRTWFYPAGLGTLGCALPGAIGAKIALPDRPVIVLVGDGGFLFTIQELATAVEEALAIPIVLWNNDSLAMIRDGMIKRGISQIGVNPKNPDFMKIAEGFGCHGVRPDSLASFASAADKALQASVPTVIEIREDADWLL